MPFDVVVPRREVGVANRPVDRDAVLRVRLEIEIAEAIALSSPRERPSADVIAAIPVEALDLGVGRVFLRYPPVEILLVQRIVALQDRIKFDHLARPATAMRILPRRFARVRVVLAVLDVLAAFEHQDAQATLGQLFGGPAPGDAGADDDRVEPFGLLAHISRDSTAAGGRCFDRPRQPSSSFNISGRQAMGRPNIMLPALPYRDRRLTMKSSTQARKIRVSTT